MLYSVAEPINTSNCLPMWFSYLSRIGLKNKMLNNLNNIAIRIGFIKIF